MILLFIFVAAIFIGIIILRISEHGDYGTFHEVLEGTGAVLVAVGSVVTLVMLLFGVAFRIPSVMERTQIKFEEKYNTLILALENNKENFLTFAGEVAEYNIKVKEYYMASEDPWIDWFNPKLEREPKYINLEDYLA